MSSASAKAPFRHQWLSLLSRANAGGQVDASTRGASIANTTRLGIIPLMNVLSQATLRRHAASRTVSWMCATLLGEIMDALALRRRHGIQIKHSAGRLQALAQSVQLFAFALRAFMITRSVIPSFGFLGSSDRLLHIPHPLGFAAREGVVVFDILLADERRRSRIEVGQAVVG